MIKAIDVSYCQKGFDFVKAKATGIEAVLIRAGISKRLDTEFKKHMANIAKTDLPYGFYWFSRAFSVVEAKAEAKACIAAIKAYKPTYPIYYDLEGQLLEDKKTVDQIAFLDNKTRTDIIIAFCDAIKAAGYVAGMYLSPSWIEEYLNKSRLIGKYPLWLAHWTYSAEKLTPYKYGQEVWQWGTIDIDDSTVDADIIYKEYKTPVFTAPTVPTNAVKLTKGKKLTLKNVGLYGGIMAKTPVRHISGTYYIYDGLVFSGFMRICPSFVNVGKSTPTVSANVTGWVKVADIK